MMPAGCCEKMTQAHRRASRCRPRVSIVLPSIAASPAPANNSVSTASKKVVWIASYPKSGNTWIRFMACNLLYGRQESAAALNALAPDLHEPGGDPNPARPAAAPAALLKTHFAFAPRLPYADQTAAAIYVVRDPADVLASNFFYSQRSARLADTTQAEFDRYVDAFLENRGDPRWIELGMGSWEENVRSWLDTPLPFPVLRIRYEDMIDDPMTACGTLAQLLRPGSTRAELKQAVDNSSFERMREIERADIREQRVGIFYKPYLRPSIDAGSRFMRRGMVGDGAARLSAPQRARLRATFDPLLSDLGYAR
jgi:aryl sulfotransferase